ncbi:MAG: hypothetical protein KDB23_33225, partial [Planctomycetales bacterium]|nr:hypothetical protein [Planctomycetales bacterium]
VVFTAADTNVEGKFFHVFSSDEANAAVTVSRATVTRIPPELATALAAGRPDVDRMFSRPINDQQFFNVIEGQTGTFSLRYHGLVTGDLAHDSTPAQIAAALSALSSAESGQFQFTVSGAGTLREPWMVTAVNADMDTKGNFFPLEIASYTNDTPGATGNPELVSTPLDLADAAATVRPSASLTNPNAFQRIYYDASAETVEIHGGGGSDLFISDDSRAATRVYGDAGNDSFIVGRVLLTKRAEIDTDGVGGPDTFVDVVDGLDGITNGVSFNGYFYGGTGDDYFEVTHNVGALELYGESGDDMFFLKSILQETGG